MEQFYKNVRITVSEETYDRLYRIAKTTGMTINEVVEKMVYDNAGSL